MELVRKILFFFDAQTSEESLESHDLFWVPPIEGYDDALIHHHLIVMYQAGFLIGEYVKSESSERIITVLPFGLSWDGHEFLDKVRDDGTWQKVKTFASAKGGSLAFAAINQIATHFSLEAAKSFVTPS